MPGVAVEGFQKALAARILARMRREFMGTSGRDELKRSDESGSTHRKWSSGRARAAHGDEDQIVRSTPAASGADLMIAAQLADRPNVGEQTLVDEGRVRGPRRACSPVAGNQDQARGLCLVD